MFPVQSGDDEATGPSFLVELGPDAVNPLAILDDEIVEELSTNQQRFLLARMAMVSDKAAAERIGIKPETVLNWKHETAFARAYKIIRSDPVNFALAVNRQIVQRAALEHMALLNHPNVRVRQWAIDLAYRNQSGDKGASQAGGDTNNFFVLMQQLVREAPAEVKEADGRVLEQPVEAEYRPIDGGTALQEGRVDPVREES